METPKLTLVPARHRASLARLRRDKWLGSRDGGVPGNTQDALVRLGVARTAMRYKPHTYAVALLTDLGCAWLEAHDPAWVAAEQNRASLAKIAEDRVARGRCRHCGGPVPCWSPYGDSAAGVRHEATP